MRFGGLRVQFKIENNLWLIVGIIEDLNGKFRV
jgi:hypothetical protein